MGRDEWSQDDLREKLNDVKNTFLASSDQFSDRFSNIEADYAYMLDNLTSMSLQQIANEFGFRFGADYEPEEEAEEEAG